MVRAGLSLAILAGAGASLVAAAPAPAPTPAPVAGDIAKRASSCTFSDAAAVSKSKTSCATIVLDNIAVPSGTTLDLTDLTDGTTVIFEGTTTFGYKEWSGPLISVSGTDITVQGASGHVINGEGSNWWDGEGSNGGKTKPKFFAAHSMKQSTIQNLNVKNTPVQSFSIDGAEGLTVTGITIDNSAGDETDSNGDALGHNTDAFDVGDSTGVYISNVNVKNQDDCLAINSGTDISFTGSTCSGGHGISIGSVGGRTDNTVENVYINNNKIEDSQNGVRIKTVYKATGSVKNVTYSDITLSGITKYGVVIEQDYENGSPTGTPTGGVPITELTLDGVTGTIDSSATNVYILCAASPACDDWTWSGVTASGGKTSSKCSNIPSGSGAECY
ncbi:Endopolygalacturonase 1 [Delphinella strobiligena]|nr:Endopolygalacturonase 1 [Delphinella strobiligena]